MNKQITEEDVNTLKIIAENLLEASGKNFIYEGDKISILKSDGLKKMSTTIFSILIK